MIFKLRNKILLFFTFSLIVNANAVNIDSLKQRIQETDGEDQIKIYSDLCWHLRKTEPQKAWYYGNKALDLSQNINYDQGIAQAYNDLGILLFDKSEFDSAIAFYQKSHEIRQKLNDVEGMASLYNKIGIVHQTRRHIDSAIVYALQALAIYDTLGKPVQLSHCVNNLGVLYYNSSLYNKSLEYHQRALRIRKQLGNKYFIGASYVNLANLHSLLLDTSKSMIYYDSALTVMEDYKLTDVYSSGLNNYGSLLVTQRKFNQALPIIEEGLEIRRKIGSEVDQTSSETMLGLCLTQLGNYKEGYYYLNKAKNSAQRLNLMQHKMELYQYLSAYHELTEDMDSALYYYKLSFKTKDTILNEDLNSQMTEMTIKFETEKKEFEIQNLSQENEIKELEIKQSQQRFYWTGAASIALLMIGLLGFLQFRNRQKRKYAEALVKEQQKGIDAVIVAEENERKRIAKDLHDGIGQQLSGLKLFYSKLRPHIERTEPQLSNELEKFEEVLDSACTDVRSISHQMMPKVLLEKGLVEALEEMLNKSLGLGSIHYNFEHFKLQKRYNERIEISIYRICQELTNNIIKHSNASEVSVQLYENKNFLILHIEDNGVGFDPKKSKNGIGQLNMSSRINTLNGKFSIDSKPGRGTSATIKIPL